MAMYTQCPECLSVFSLNAHTLAQAHAFVTCSHCGADFDSLATLADTLPAAPFQQLPLNMPALAPPLVDLVVYRPSATPAPDVAEVTETTTLAPAATDHDFANLVFAGRTQRQRKARQQPHRHLHAERGRRWPWVLACIALTAVLATQLAWTFRTTLLTRAPSSEWLRAACATLHCTLPLVAAPQQIHLLDSNVQTHPSMPHALLISASVRNDARFAQPWPVVVLTLSNARGERIAMRRLQPRQYLDDVAVRAHGLAPGASAVLVLEVTDPGAQAVAFEFAFE